MQQVCARASNVLEAQRRDAAAGHLWGRQRRAPPADDGDDEVLQGWVCRRAWGNFHQHVCF